MVLYLFPSLFVLEWIPAEFHNLATAQAKLDISILKNVWPLYLVNMRHQRGPSLPGKCILGTLEFTWIAPFGIIKIEEGEKKNGKFVFKSFHWVQQWFELRCKQSFTLCMKAKEMKRTELTKTKKLSKSSQWSWLRTWTKNQCKKIRFSVSFSSLEYRNLKK